MLRSHHLSYACHIRTGAFLNRSLLQFVYLGNKNTHLGLVWHTAERVWARSECWSGPWPCAQLAVGASALWWPSLAPSASGPWLTGHCCIRRWSGGCAPSCLTASCRSGSHWEVTGSGSWSWVRRTKSDNERSQKRVTSMSTVLLVLHELHWPGNQNTKISFKVSVSATDVHSDS